MKKLDAVIGKERDTAWSVTIVGHASDHLPAKGEWNNYLYSMDRALSAFDYLRKALRAQNVKAEWHLRPVSNDDGMIVTRFLPGWDHKRSVEVLLQKKSDSISLLDYLYFMIYTITTTGYGDFVPISPRAKFICSVANLFELLFIVVVINLVFAYAKE